MKRIKRNEPNQGSRISTSRSLQTWGFVFAYSLILGSFIALTFSNWGYDDPYITYRYAENISNGLGFVYNLGENILSTSTPLFTLLLALLRGVTSDIPKTAIFIGAASLSLGGLLLWDLSYSWGRPIAGWVALILYPLFPLLLSTLSSEIPLYLLFCIGAFAMYARRRYNWSAIFAALAFFTRHDAALVAIILLSDYILLRRRPLPWQPVALFLAITIPWLAYTVVVFGSPIPVTLAAKQYQGSMAISLTFIPSLIKIIQQSYADIWQYWAAAILAVVGLLSPSGRDRKWFLFLSWPILHMIAFIILGVSGYFWYYGALIPGFIVAVGLGVDTIYDLFHREGIFEPFPARMLGGLILMLIVTPVIAHGLQVQSHPDSRLGIYEAVGTWLEKNTESKSVVGALEVGIIGYFSEREMIDFAGIIQPPIAERLGPTTNYEDSAIWATKTYPPDYVVLNSPGYTRLLDQLILANCKSIREFKGDLYEYESDLILYQCEW